MPVIPVGAQVFDLVFHPTNRTVYLGLLTGEVKALQYDENGEAEEVWSLRETKRSCRALAMNHDGSRLYAVGKSKAMYTTDTETGQMLEKLPGIHNAAVNRIKYLMPNLLITGDDDGVIKLWDPRKNDALREYTQHFDFISDFMWIEDKRQVVITSGDGTLSVIDARASKSKPIAHSEDQEDELLSIVPIRGGEKTVVGTQLGTLSIFDKSKGWGDCVDRVLGHPQSIDALCSLPTNNPLSYSTILTGSSDGLLRAVQLFPTKLIGVVTDHGDFPIERIAVDLAGSGHWVGSVGHDEALHLTDLNKFFEGDKESFDGERNDEGDSGDEQGSTGEVDGSSQKEDWTGFTEENHSDADGKDDSDSDSDIPVERKKRRRKDRDPLGADTKKRKGAKNEMIADPSFFADL